MYHVLQNLQNDCEPQLYHQEMLLEEVVSQMYPKNIQLPAINTTFSLDVCNIIISINHEKLIVYRF